MVTSTLLTTTAYWWGRPQPYNVNFDGNVFIPTMQWMIFFIFLAVPVLLIVTAIIITNGGDLHDRGSNES